MYELENPETTALTAVQDLELPAELTQNNNFFGDNTSETLPQNVNLGDGSDDILLEPSRMGSNLSLSDESPATNEDPLTGEPLLDVISRESSQSAILPESVNLVLENSELLGGSGRDGANDVAIDKEGNIYITGITNSTDFLITPNAVQRNFGGGIFDAFVTKISPDGTLLYSTYIGGSDNDFGSGIAVDDTGNIYVTGNTLSADFPTLNALQNSYGGGQIGEKGDVFVTKISADGSNIVYSTYLGGQDEDSAQDIAIDDSGNVYITGNTGGFSPSSLRPVGAFGDFPTTENAPQKILGSEFNRDAFVSKISADGSNLVYSTLLGGSGTDEPLSITLDSDGNAYITGGTSSADFPLANPTQSIFGGDSDIFIAQLNSEGSEFVYSTFYGATDGDVASSIAVDAAGNIYVTGLTGSPIVEEDAEEPIGDFPVINGFQSTFGGDRDAVVVKINSDRSVGYASFFGGGGRDLGNGIAVSATGSAYIVGNSIGEPFVSKISSNGANLENSVFIGGSSGDVATDIAIDSAGNAYIAGGTNSPDFPESDGFSGFGLFDGFVAQIATVAENPVSNILIAFDDSLYLAENPEVADAVAQGTFVSGLEHWVKFGFSEGRQPQIDFDEEFYLAAYPEVAEAVANGAFPNGLAHYVLFGAAENRQAVA